MQLETTNYLMRGVSPFLLWMTTSINVGSAPSLFVRSPAASQQQKWANQGSRGKTKTVNTQTRKLVQPLAQEPREEQGNTEKDRGRGCVEAPGAVGRSHTRGARRQTQFTKRHLFHYSNALWLITSWPVCEMTATYSPVNRKICTCSIWGVGEQRRGG